MVFIAIAAMGCETASAPVAAGMDPTVWIVNASSTDSIFFSWRDGQGIVGAETILPGDQICEHFLARPDSASFEAEARAYAQPGQQISYTYSQPWFDPNERSAWTMTYNRTAYGGFLVVDVSAAPNPPC
jgi:hypothetical protein